MLYRCPYELLFETRDSECNILESSISCRISCISYMLISSEFHFFSGNMIHHTCNLKDELCMLSLWGVQQDLWAVKEINTVWAVITVSLDVAVKKSAHTRCGDEALANVRVRTFFFHNAIQHVTCVTGKFIFTTKRNQHGQLAAW